MIFREHNKKALYPWLVLLLVASFLIIPIQTASAEATTVEVGSTAATTGQAVQVTVMVKNVPPPGLAAYDFKLNFNPAGLKIDSIAGGDRPFDSTPTNSLASKITPAGEFLFNSFVAVMEGPTTILVAKISVSALAPGNWPLTLTIKDLNAPDGAPITATIVNGSIQASGPTLTPSPTATPTATPTTPGPTATPTTPVTATPAGTPTTTPAGTTVEVGSASVAPGATAQVPITVKSFTASGGFGSYNFKLNFKPEGILVDSIKAGAEPFGDPAAANINNNVGLVLLNDFHSQVPGPKGNIVVANVVVKGVAPGSWSLALTITDLVAIDGADIPATVVNGTVTVAGAPVPPTATPTAKPSPVPTTVTPAPTASPKPSPTTPAVTSPPPTKPPTPAPTATVAPKPTPSPTPPPPPAPTTNWGLIIGVIVAAIVVIVVLVLVFKKKPAA